MRSIFAPASWMPLLAAAMLAAPVGALAQGFSADYGLIRPGVPAIELVPHPRVSLFELGGVRVGPALQADGRYSGAGLSVAAGQNWFGQVTVGRSLQAIPGLAGPTASDTLKVAGGYRWSDGQALSLQLSGGRGPERLGLSVSYDWPRYFVRLSYDSRLTLVPAETLRFSAGVRF